MKKALFLLMALLVSITLIACGEVDSDDSKQAVDTPDVEETESNDDEAEETETETEANVEEDEVDEEQTESEDVPREYRNALKAAQNYIDLMHFSEKGLFEQLTSEFGDQYPEEAAQYAIENVDVDYKEEALEAAISYLEFMPMSDQELFEQLTSEYGEQFTDEQAQYALDNLPE